MPYPEREKSGFTPGENDVKIVNVVDDNNLFFYDNFVLD
jgi:hypothetical protein